MSDEIIKAEKAHQIHQNIIDAKRGLSKGFLRLSFLLKTASDERIYEGLGYESWEQYLATPEISVSVSTASRLINVWEQFVVKYQIATSQLEEIDLSKLTEILPVVRRLNSKNEVEDWLNKARLLAINDLKVEKKEYLTGISPSDCDHNYIHREYWRCSQCGIIENHNPNQNGNRN